MTDPDKSAANGEQQHDPAAVPNDASKPSLDPVTVRAERLARARELGRRLRTEVVIHDWLGNEVELTFVRHRDYTIWPVKVRVGGGASDETVLSDRGVLASCQRYNASLHGLRQLAKQLEQKVRQSTIRLEPGSPVEEAHRQLSDLDDLIVNRQRITMGNRVVRLTTLHRETTFLESYHDLTASIIEAAGRTTDDDADQAASVRTQPSSPLSRWFAWLYERGAATFRTRI